MRVGMGLIKNEHGVWLVRKKVPKRLEAATATVLGNGKPRVSWLKKTLRTKDKKQATITAKPVMMKFDRILADAEALLAERPLRTELSETEIKQLADYFYAHELNAKAAPNNLWRMEKSRSVHRSAPFTRRHATHAYFSHARLSAVLPTDTACGFPNWSRSPRPWRETSSPCHSACRRTEPARPQMDTR